MTADPSQRAASFVAQRWDELLDPGTLLGRRARTLNVRASMSEAADLARAHYESGGVTNSAQDPGKAGHGVKTLPDVIQEAQALLTQDVVLRGEAPAMLATARDALSRIEGNMDRLTDADVRRLETVRDALEGTYAVHCLDFTENTISNDPRSLTELDAAVGALVTELRSRGWADETVRGMFGGVAPDAFRDGFAALRSRVEAAPRDFDCYVPLTPLMTVANDATILSDARFVALPTIPPGAKRAAHYVHVRLRGYDPIFLARTAFDRASAVTGAVSIFVPHVKIDGPTVIVDDGSTRRVIQVSPTIPTEARQWSTAQLSEIARATWETVDANESDAVLEAIRHRERGLRTPDTESRFMLVWLGMERLVLGSHDYDRIMNAISGLVPASIVSAKLRREVTALAAAINALELTDVDGRALRELVGTKSHRVDRERLVALLLQPDSSALRPLTSFFYDTQPRIVQWLWSLQKALGGRDPQKVAAYFDSSTQRLTWHMRRLYRARNSVAHAGRGPAWLGDLVAHALFYLTQLIALVLHHRARQPWCTSTEVFEERVARHATFMQLLRQGHARALEPATLLRPSSLFEPDASRGA